MTSTNTNSASIRAAVILAALGYFVDIYDLILFSIVRITSLKSLGVPEAELMSTGVLLINMQMTGMLVGGIFWGILGDKKGRLSVLLASIVMYSLANLANAFVGNIFQYSILRFIAGIGLAGELGAGITLVSEIMPKETRGFGTMIVATVGILGAVLAALVADFLDWRIAYAVGGVLGLALLLLRINVFESGLFVKTKQSTSSRGNFFTIFKTPKLLGRYLSVIFIGLPTWYLIGILITFSPEFAKALNVVGPVSAGNAVMYSYLGLALGDLISGLMSQVFKSRKKVILSFLIAAITFVGIYLNAQAVTNTMFYLCIFGLGVGGGYWALFVTVGAEQFGTNLRATVATTVPNFARGAVVPLTLLFKSWHESMGTLNAGFYVGCICFSIALIAWFFLQETFGKDLDYLE